MRGGGGKREGRRRMFGGGTSPVGVGGNGPVGVRHQSLGLWRQGKETATNSTHKEPSLPTCTSYKQKTLKKKKCEGGGEKGLPER